MVWEAHSVLAGQYELKTPSNNKIYKDKLLDKSVINEGQTAISTQPKSRLGQVL
jgi:hypothetical protein